MRKITNTAQKVQKSIPFTREKYQEMQMKVIKLESQREQVMQRLIEARAMGDLSENGAYKYAKFELGNISRQLAKYKSLLAKGFPAPKNTAGKSIVDFGSVVTIRKSTSTVSKDFMIVSEHESDPSQGKIAYTSPLGKALIRKKKGDTVLVTTPTGEVRYTIINIS